MNKKMKSLKGKLTVSCQTLPHESFHSTFIMGRMVLAAKEGGVYGIRAGTKEDIVETQTQIDLPVIDIVKRDYEGSKVYITPTMEEINELMEVKPEIIALDTTGDLRPGGRALGGFHREIRKSYPGQLLMVDRSTVEETLHADQLGFDFIGTTLVGYIGRNGNLKIKSNNFEIIHRIMATVRHRIIAEGNINMPEKTKRVIELRAFGTVVGSIVARPQLITKSLAQALN